MNNQKQDKKDVLAPTSYMSDTKSAIRVRSRPAPPYRTECMSAMAERTIEGDGGRLGVLE